MKKGLKQMTVEAMQAEQNRVVKSAKPKPVKKAAPKKQQKLFPVAPLDMKIGMTISLHGKVTSAEMFTGSSIWKKGKQNFMNVQHGRKAPKGYKLFREGLKGVLLKTAEHPGGLFYQEDATVWCVR